MEEKLALDKNPFKNHKFNIEQPFMHLRKKEEIKYQSNNREKFLILMKMIRNKK
jgi:hypothetical protein